MNFVVRTYSGKTVVRPDTTRIRQDENIYPPEAVKSISCAPALFIKMTRAGRSIDAGFASRYRGETVFGLLLYPENFLDGSLEGYACASCVDRTTYLPFETTGCAPFTVKAGSEQFCTVEQIPGDDLIDAAIEEVSSLCWIRVGDYVVIELAPRKLLIGREEAVSTHIEAESCGEKVFEFDVIF